jgi:hypothetical protein
VHKLCDVSSLHDANGRWLRERRYPSTDILFGCLKRRHVSRYLLLLASDLLNDTLKSGEIAHHSLELLL